MAVDFGGQDIATEAGGDLSEKQYHAVMMGTDGKIATAEDRSIGILQNAPSESGRLGLVRINGVSRVIVSGAVEEGIELAVGDAGKLQQAFAGDYVIAVALEPADSCGDSIRALVVNYQKNA